ncbi:substrate-binding domain-containing protein [Schlesneria sp. DSM 10557]|uniref:substrate-binding domain-containing protein n=1 Tax=Schlesneria sp. DSM 10557 TaxID=3044399 RepID=UPI0035A0DB0C
MTLSRILPGQILLVLVSLVFVGCEPNVPKSETGDKSAPSASASGSPTGTSGNLKRLIILTNGDSPYWDACRQGLLAAGSDLKLKDDGLVAELDVNDGTAQGQLSKLQQYATQSDIAGVGVSAIDAKNVAIADELRSLQKKGIKILTIDSDVDRSQFADARYAFIGTNNLAGGRLLGKCAAELKPEGGEYVTFVGFRGAQNAIDRIEGFAEGAGEKLNSKDTMEDGTDKTKARDNVRNAIRNHPDLNFLVGIWSYNAPAIVDVVKESNRRKDFTIVVFDAEPTAITAMKEGNIDAMVVQNPFGMGYEGIRALAALVRNQKETLTEMFPRYGQDGGDIFDTGLKVVIPSNESPLNPNHFEGVEVITLERFQEWLSKYDLTGS